MSEQLPRSARVRVGLAVGASIVLALVGAPTEILALGSDSGTAEVVLAFALGVGLPLLGLLIAWGMARRYRRGGGPATRQPSTQARQLLVAGKWSSVALMLVVIVVVRHGVLGVIAGLVALAVAYVSVFSLARRLDPSLRWWRGTGTRSDRDA